MRLVDTRAAGTDVTVGNNQASGSNLTEEELPIITIPSEVLVPVGPSPMVPVTTVVFRNLDAFLPRQLNGGMLVYKPIYNYWTYIVHTDQ